MKPIVAHKQVALGPMRCVQLALTGMSYRMFRSIVTVAILALAVAFLVHMLSYGLLSGAVQTSAYQELRTDREAGEAVSRLAKADNVKTILAVLADGQNADRLAEYRVWSGLNSEAFDQTVQAAAGIRVFGEYIDRLPPASHAALIGVYTPSQMLDRLSDTEQFERFRLTTENLSLPMPMDDWSRLSDFVRINWPDIKSTAASIRRGHLKAIESIRAIYPDTNAFALFKDMPASFDQTLRDNGFAIEPDEARAISDFVIRATDRQSITDMLTDEDVRAMLSRRMGIDPKEASAEAALRYLDSLSRAKWFAQVLRENKAPASLTSDRILELSAIHLRQARLEQAAGDEPPDPGTGFMGLPLSTLYLIGLSFLVCVVGVANAMLMSVTERFTEIATMKCLGAMDRFVMMMFVFEAAIQGLIGGTLGLILGIVLAMLRGLIDYGTLLSAAGSVSGRIFYASLLSLGVGVLLATIAAVGPSWVAARLAPMEAMRVE